VFVAKFDVAETQGLCFALSWRDCVLAGAGGEEEVSDNDIDGVIINVGSNEFCLTEAKEVS